MVWDFNNDRLMLEAIPSIYQEKDAGYLLDQANKPNRQLYLADRETNNDKIIIFGRKDKFLNPELWNDSTNLSPTNGKECPRMLLSKPQYIKDKYFIDCQINAGRRNRTKPKEKIDPYILKTRQSLRRYKKLQSTELVLYVGKLPNTKNPFILNDLKHIEKAKQFTKRLTALKKPFINKPSNKKEENPLKDVDKKCKELLDNSIEAISILSTGKSNQIERVLILTEDKDNEKLQGQFEDKEDDDEHNFILHFPKRKVCIQERSCQKKIKIKNLPKEHSTKIEI